MGFCPLSRHLLFQLLARCGTACLVSVGRPGYFLADLVPIMLERD